MKNNFQKIYLVVFGLLAITTTKIWSQIQGEFESPVICTGDYTPISAGGAGVTIFQHSDFKDYSVNGNTVQRTNITNADDGYAEYTLPFNFTFSNITTNKIYICVNGFISFRAPLNLPAKFGTQMFLGDPANYMTHVVAPFWGDHRYRILADGAQYTPSQILVQQQADGVVIEWKNLNINDQTKASSIGNFQAKIYKPTIVNNNQGNIEFSYGLVNGGSGNEVVTQGAAIGLKGQNADYLNGLCYDPNDLTCNPTASQRLSNVWQPSGGTNKKICFNIEPVTPAFDSWGDGDTDLSHGVGGRHFGFAQNRFVSFNDVKRILRSIVEKKPLDSVYGRDAFHADVDHDGRFYRIDTVVWKRNQAGFYVASDNSQLIYNASDESTTFYSNVAKTNVVDIVLNNGIPIDPNRAALIGIVFNDSTLRENIVKRSDKVTDDLPSKVSSPQTQIFFHADEDDARLITSYLQVKVVSLPWIYDTTSNGKASGLQIANDISFGAATAIGNLYKIPVYINGLANNGISTKFDLNTEIVNIELVENNDAVSLTDFNNGSGVIVGSGVYNTENPVAYIYVNNEISEITASDVRFNNEDKNNKTIVLNNDGITNNVLVTPNPYNPEAGNVNFNININNEGIYTISIYDVVGHLVKTIYNDKLIAGVNTIEFNGLDAANNRIESGMYLINIEGNNSSLVQKFIVK